MSDGKVMFSAGKDLKQCLSIPGEGPKGEPHIYDHEMSPVDPHKAEEAPDDTNQVEGDHVVGEAV